ncbi:unnamed protein product, partial [Closterium sp. NIES-53]
CFAFLDWSCDLLFFPTLPMGFVIPRSFTSGKEDRKELVERGREREDERERTNERERKRERMNERERTREGENYRERMRERE